MANWDIGTLIEDISSSRKGTIVGNIYDSIFQCSRYYVEWSDKIGTAYISGSSFLEATHKKYGSLNSSFIPPKFSYNDKIVMKNGTLTPGVISSNGCTKTQSGLISVYLIRFDGDSDIATMLVQFVDNNFTLTGPVANAIIGRPIYTTPNLASKLITPSNPSSNLPMGSKNAFFGVDPAMDPGVEYSLGEGCQHLYEEQVLFTSSAFYCRFCHEKKK